MEDWDGLNKQCSHITHVVENNHHHHHLFRIYYFMNSQKLLSFFLLVLREDSSQAEPKDSKHNRVWKITINSDIIYNQHTSTQLPTMVKL